MQSTKTKPWCSRKSEWTKRVRSLNQQSKPPNKDYPWPGGFPGILYHTHTHTHTHELISVLFKLGQKVERILPNLFYRPENKARQGNYKKRKIQAYIPDKYRYKNSQQDSSKPNTAAI